MAPSLYHSFILATLLISPNATNAYAFIPLNQHALSKKPIMKPQTVTMHPYSTTVTTTTPPPTTKTTLFSSPSEDEIEEMISKSKLSPEQVNQVGNLVADDEWMGLGMELSELVRVAVIEEVKKNAADFLGKDDYKVGDISKEIDSRVKVIILYTFIDNNWYNMIVIHD